MSPQHNPKRASEKLQEPEVESTSKYTAIVENVIKSYIDEVQHPKENHGQSMEPYYYLRTTLHKSIWKDLLEALNYWFKLPNEKLQFVQEFTETLYNQLILFDDIVDDSDYRYGQPTAHRIFGNKKTLISSTLLSLLIVKKFNELNQPKTIELLCNHLIIACNALVCENDHVNNACPTVDQALKHAVRKTGSFFLMISEIMQCFSDCKTDFTWLNALLALNIQNMNDYINLSRNKKSCLNDKSFAEDVSRGYFSLPIVFAAQKESLERSKMLSIVRKKTKELDLNHYCVDLIEQLGGIEESKILEKEVDKLILEEINKLGGNPKLIQTLNKLRKCKGDMMNPKSPMYESF